MGIEADQRIGLGRIVGVFGIKGWVKVQSWTRPIENILDYPEWQVSHAGKWQCMRLTEGRVHGQGLVAQLANVEGVRITDRNQAEGLVGSEIAVGREQLPPAAPHEFYWIDLIGLEVETLEGRPLGKVRELFETPAHDMLVVKGERERLIPCVIGPIVKDVDLSARRIRVDWDPDHDQPLSSS
jgi:16S rRNA processing protein RimM